jgi:hypothetical protein
LRIKRSTWDERFKNLQKFIEENNRLPYSNVEDDSEVKLYRFMIVQLKRANRSQINEEKISLISNLVKKFGYVKKERHLCKPWDDSYSDIIEFVKRNKRLPKANDDDEKNMYQFFYHQRKLYFEQNLPSNFIDRFVEIANLLNVKA